MADFRLGRWAASNTTAGGKGLDGTLAPPGSSTTSDRTSSPRSPLGRFAVHWTRVGVALLRLRQRRALHATKFDVLCNCTRAHFRARATAHRARRPTTPRGQAAIRGTRMGIAQGRFEGRRARLTTELSMHHDRSRAFVYAPATRHRAGSPCAPLSHGAVDGAFVSAASLRLSRWAGVPAIGSIRGDSDGTRARPATTSLAAVTPAVPLVDTVHRAAWFGTAFDGRGCATSNAAVCIVRKDRANAPPRANATRD